ncbi:MAG: tail fiber domain-containing protein [Chitinophagaceae bacterium]|nr:tail fiber domain-containing protein [Chitinophagaceae bacterium]
MKAYLILFPLLVLSLLCQGQSVGIGTPTPNASAILDVTAGNKGVLFPRLSLASSTDAVAVPSPATYLIVTNTNSALPDGAGLYINMGTPAAPNWVKIGGASSGSNAWSLTGNAGTVDGTNFIGTTDNVPLTVRVNNQKAGRIDNNLLNTFWGYQAGNSNIPGNGNTGIGGYALYSNTGLYNTANGAQALFFNTTGTSNTANGYFALLKNNTGNNNTAIGMQTLQNNTTGYSNVAMGVSALFTNTTNSNLVAIGDSALFNNGNGGILNTAIGSKSLYSNTTGRDNVANGYQSLQNNLTGVENTAIGTYSLYSNTSGLDNTATGWRALHENNGNTNTADGLAALELNTLGNENTATGFVALRQNEIGNYNTAIGAYALISNKTGNNNTGIGNEADVSTGNLTNATAVGYKATVDASNKIRLGNTSVTVIEGQVAYSYPSDARFKYNIKTNVPGLDLIKKLTPVTYYFDDIKLTEYTKTGVLNNTFAKNISYDGNKQLHTGFLAQDVEKIAMDLGYEFDGVHAPANDKDHYSLAYSQFIMPLVKAVQEQQVIIEKLTKQVEQSEIPMMIGKQQIIIEDQQKQINKMDKQIEELVNAVKALKK